MSDPLLTVSLFTVVGFLLVVLAGMRSKVVLPSIVTYVIHWVVAMLVYHFFGLVFPDARYYDNLALDTISSTDRVVAPGKEAWPDLLTFIYQAFGHSPVLGLIINVTVAGVTVAVLAVIAERLGLPSRLTAWLFGLFPFAVLWGSLLLRESLTWFFMYLLILGFLGIASGKRLPYNIVLSVVAFTGFLFMRGTVALVVLAGALLGIAIARRQVLRLAGATAVLVLVALSPLGGTVQRIVGNYTLDQIGRSRIELSETATTGFPIDNILSVFSRVLLGPFPWEWPVVTLLAFDGVLWLLVLVLAVRGWLSAPNQRMLLILVMPIIVLLVTLAITSGNYGTMQRLRVQPAVLMLPLVAAGLLGHRKGPLDLLEVDESLLQARPSRVRRHGRRAASSRARNLS